LKVSVVLGEDNVMTSPVPSDARAPVESVKVTLNSAPFVEPAAAPVVTAATTAVVGVPAVETTIELEMVLAVRFAVDAAANSAEVE
jgi:hypothetical protein